MSARVIRSQLDERQRKNMKPVTLQIPVSDPQGRLLLPRGTVLTSAKLKSLCTRREGPERGQVSLLRCGTVRQDLELLLRAEPYRLIFGNPDAADTVLRLMERVRVPADLPSFLAHFKRHARETYYHTLRVTALTTLIGRVLLETVHDLTQGILAAVVHDFGKTCVPGALLEKPRPLTPPERGLLEQHTLAGFVLVSVLLGNPDGLPARAARDHHERRDGSGYPRGVRQRDRMVEIIAASDIYDALVSDRVYREQAYENRKALEEITGMAETGKIGWEVVRALVSYNRLEKPDPGACIVSGDRRRPTNLTPVRGNGDPDEGQGSA